MVSGIVDFPDRGRPSPFFAGEGALILSADH